MADINMCIFTGRLGADPELKRTPSGRAVCDFRIAVSRPKAKNAEQAEVDWLDVVTWDGTAESSAQYLSKGQRVTVKGPLRTRFWTDKGGNRHREVELYAEQVVFMNSKTLEMAQPAVVNAEDNFEELSSDDELPF